MIDQNRLIWSRNQVRQRGTTVNSRKRQGLGCDDGLNLSSHERTFWHRRHHEESCHGRKAPAYLQCHAQQKALKWKLLYGQEYQAWL